MQPVVVEKDKDGTIHLTAEELEKMLRQAYDEGYNAGKITTLPAYPQYPEYPQPNRPWVWWNHPYCSDSITVISPTLSDNSINSARYAKFSSSIND